MYAQGSCCKELPRGKNNVLKASDFAMSQEDDDAYSSSDLKDSHKMDSTRSSQLREISVLRVTHRALVFSAGRPSAQRPTHILAESSLSVFV